jgi:hypothetical protein
MIARLWHGWTTCRNADAYENLLKSEVFPRIGRIPGSAGAYLLARTPQAGGEVEFVTMTLFDSMDAVRAFAGSEFERAVVPPEAQKLLSRFDPTSVHYEILAAPR